jgi:pyruvate/2-oxoglutarate dehydrogenase complex dihydrolipoamide dehydrogenase (E3) component
MPRLAFGWLPSPGREPHYPSTTFTDPEVAQVGPSLELLQKQYGTRMIRSEFVALENTDRGYTMQLDHGFVLIHCMALTGTVLSATIVAPNAGEMISLLTFAVNHRIRMYALSDLVFPYPVLSEAIKKAADGFVFGTLGKLPRELLCYFRYRLGSGRRRSDGG